LVQGIQQIREFFRGERGEDLFRATRIVKDLGKL
jgi:hypothetical protein